VGSDAGRLAGKPQQIFCKGRPMNLTVAKARRAPVRSEYGYASKLHCLGRMNGLSLFGRRIGIQQEGGTVISTQNPFSSMQQIVFVAAGRDRSRVVETCWDVQTLRKCCSGSSGIRSGTQQLAVSLQITCLDIKRDVSPPSSTPATVAVVAKPPGKTPFGSAAYRRNRA